MCLWQGLKAKLAFCPQGLSREECLPESHSSEGNYLSLVLWFNFSYVINEAVERGTIKRVLSVLLIGEEVKLFGSMLALLGRLFI